MVQVVKVRSEDVRPGDMLVMSTNARWTVERVEPYAGALPELHGGFVAHCWQGPVALEPGADHDVVRA